jgi:Cu+-exporting ATPase
MTTNKFKINGMHCPACKKLTEKRFSTIAGVTAVNVNLETGMAEIKANNTITKTQLDEVLSDTGYSVA